MGQERQDAGDGHAPEERHRQHRPRPREGHHPPEQRHRVHRFTRLSHARVSQSNLLPPRGGGG